MIIDDQSLRDLEIFQTHENAPGLFYLLDHTHTRGGRERLRSRFQHPLSDAGRIREVQESLKFISESRECFAPLPPDRELIPLSQYLHSNLDLIRSCSRKATFFESVIVRLGYPDLYEQVVAGLHLSSGVIDTISEFIAQHLLLRAPGELGQIVAEMRALLASLAGRGIPARISRWRFAALLRADRSVRNEARAELERILQLVYEVDALVSMADAVRDRSFTFPDVCEGGTEVDGKGVFHPFLSSPVPNDIHADNANRVLLITGPNMAGKSTYLRSCATATYLAHLGMGVPARQFRFTPFEVLITAIVLTDNIRTGVSLFRAETLRIKQIASLVVDGMRVFSVLDEPFKGTNVKDALDASACVLAGFAVADGSVFLVASHLTELSQVLPGCQSVAYYKFEAHENGALEFDFRLRSGISSQRLGMRVLKDEGVTGLLQRLERGV